MKLGGRSGAEQGSQETMLKLNKRGRSLQLCRISIATSIKSLHVHLESPAHPDSHSDRASEPSTFLAEDRDAPKSTSKYAESLGRADPVYR